jgi:AraC-like DNA-binding protein
MPGLRPEYISVTNVRPAYAASCAVGVSEEALENVGLPRALVEDDSCSVAGEVTYAHMELMERRGGFGSFLVDAASRHTIASLGVVGLACKTVPTVREALTCHQRFQHLTNRTAHYTTEADARHITMTEHRVGAPRRGHVLISDYTMLVAVQLLRVVAADTVPVVAMHSRRQVIDPDERSMLEAFLQAPVSTGFDHAAIVLPTEMLAAPVARADPDLAAYFTQVLARAAHFKLDEPEVVARARIAIQDALASGTPTGIEIGKRLGMSQRTLQRRLHAEGHQFQALVSDTRMRLAEGYLSDLDLSLAEVAYLLGYREETSFFRSFRRWKGVTPAGWRQAREAPHR